MVFFFVCVAFVLHAHQQEINGRFFAQKNSSHMPHHGWNSMKCLWEVHLNNSTSDPVCWKFVPVTRLSYAMIHWRMVSISSVVVTHLMNLRILWETGVNLAPFKSTHLWYVFCWTQHPSDPPKHNGIGIPVSSPPGQTMLHVVGLIECGQSSAEKAQPFDLLCRRSLSHWNNISVLPMLSDFVS